jgi:hypothetical protein
MVRHALGAGFAETIEFIAGPDREKREQEQQPKAAQIEPSTRERETIHPPSWLEVWRQSVDPRTPSVEKYLQSRALAVDADLAGRVLRWNSRISALVALFRNIETGAPQAISRTFLDAEGRKIERKFLGPVGGAAIMLDPFDAVTYGLTVGEGVETCMAARQLGIRPVWALGSAGAIERFPVLSGVECLSILLELDAGASDRAVSRCAERWRDAGREGFIVTPTVGKDLNDALGACA